MAVLAFFAIAAGLGVALTCYNVLALKSTTLHQSIPANTTYAVHSVNLFEMSKVRITSTRDSQPTQLFTADVDCDSQSIVSTTTFDIKWNSTGSGQNTYPLNNGTYFGPGSMINTLANITASQGSINECPSPSPSAALYLFNTYNDFSNFLGNNDRKTFYHEFCFNVSQNETSQNEASPQKLMVNDAVTLYFGMYLPQNPPLMNAELRIYGTVNLYNQSNLIAECNISVNNEDTCEIILTSGVQLDSKKRCILAYSHFNQNLNLEFFSSFPQNFINVILLVTLLLSLVIIIVFIILSFLFHYYCNR